MSYVMSADGTPMKSDLRDIIYFDVSKAASVYSQIDRGLLQEIRDVTEEARDIKTEGGIDIKVVKVEGGRNSQDKTSTAELRIPHHDLLVRLETHLKGEGLLLDLNEVISPYGSLRDYSDESIRDLIQHPAFIMAEGRAEFVDYRRFGDMLPRIGEIMTMNSTVNVEQFERSDEYREMKDEIERNRLLVKEIRDQKDREIAKATISALEKNIKTRLEELRRAGELAPSIKLITPFTTTLMANRLDLKIRPYEQNLRFRVLANLKRDCFLDTDIENVLFLYGVRPDVPLTVFGLTTSIPPKSERAPDLSELLNASQNSQEGFESLFDSLQSAFEGLGQFTRFSYYPNITIYPIAVYQRLGSLVPEGEGSAIP